MFCQMFDKDSEESGVEGIADPEGGKIRYSPLLCNCFPRNTYTYKLYVSNVSVTMIKSLGEKA